MTEQELLVEILKEVIDKADGRCTQDLVDLWEFISKEKWKIYGDEIIKDPDSCYDD